MPASTILFFSPGESPDADPQVGEVLSGIGHTIDTVLTPPEAVEAAPNHHLIVLDDGAGRTDVEPICREIRGSGEIAAIPILCVSETDDIEARIRLLEAGADDVVARPFDRADLEARVEALLLRFQRTRRLAPSAPDQGVLAAPVKRSVAVFGPKGGAGTTSLAVNLAIEAARRRPHHVGLIDLDLQWGQVVTHLNLEVRQTLLDVVRDESALREPEILRTYGLVHEAGVHVLAAPGSPQYAELVTGQAVESLLATALGTWEVVVVDAGSALDDRTLAVLDAVDSVVVPVYPEISCLKVVHTLMEYLAEAGTVGSKTLIVLNNLFARESLKRRDVENALGIAVAAELPYDPLVMLKAVNEGVPVVMGAPRSDVAERIGRLAALALGEDHVEARMAPAPRRGGRLGGLLRRS